MSAIGQRMAEFHAQMGWTFTAEEHAQINSDAKRSADVLYCDLRRPVQVNEQIHRRLALELVDKHNAATVLERKVVLSLAYLEDMLALGRASETVAHRTQQADRVQLVDRPWRVGTKFLLLYAGNPRFVAPIDNLAEWRYVAERFQERFTRVTSNGKPELACDVGISTRCVKTQRLRTIHFKTGQYLCLHRACDRCVDWLMYNRGSVNKKRLAALMAYEG